MANILVNSNQLRSAADALEQLNAQFKTAITNLNTDENTLASQWEGDAQKAFRTAFQKNYQQFEEFHKGITEYINTLRTIAQTYDNTEDKNVALV